MALIEYNRVPEVIRTQLGDEAGDFFDSWFRETFGPDIGERGRLDRANVVNVESLQTGESSSLKVLRATGDGENVSFADPPGLLAKYVLLEADPELPNDRVATGGTNITIVEDATNGLATWNVSPQGAGSLLDADFLDARDSTQFVWSIAKSGETGLVQDVTLSEGSNVTLTQVGNDIEIAASGGGGGAPVGAQYLVLVADGTLTDERVFTPGTSLSVTDNGAGLAYDINTVQDIRTSASPTFTGLTLSGFGAGVVQSNGSGVLSSSSQPTISDFTNANHNHENAAGGGTLSIVNATTGTLTVARGGTGATTAAGARTNLGLVIGTDVQAWDDDLDDIAALAHANGNFIVSDGTDWVVESGNTARTSLGLGTGDSPTFTDLTLSSFTSGSVLFAGTGGAVSENNTAFRWNNTSGAEGLNLTATHTTGADLSDFDLTVTTTGASTHIGQDLTVDLANTSAAAGTRNVFGHRVSMSSSQAFNMGIVRGMEMALTHDQTSGSWTPVGLNFTVDTDGGAGIATLGAGLQGACTWGSSAAAISNVHLGVSGIIGKITVGGSGDPCGFFTTSSPWSANLSQVTINDNTAQNISKLVADSIYLTSFADRNNKTITELGGIEIAADAGNTNFLANTNGPAITTYYGLRHRSIAANATITNGYGLWIQDTNSHLVNRIQPDTTIGRDANPGATLDVIQDAASGSAQPVLRLEQDDVSEEFIEFDGTSAAANLTQSLVRQASVTTATTAGYVEVSVTDTSGSMTGTYYLQLYTLA